MSWSKVKNLKIGSDKRWPNGEVGDKSPRFKRFPSRSTKCTKHVCTCACTSDGMIVGCQQQKLAVQCTQPWNVLDGKGPSCGAAGERSEFGAKFLLRKQPPLRQSRSLTLCTVASSCEVKNRDSQTPREGNFITIKSLRFLEGVSFEAVVSCSIPNCSSRKRHLCRKLNASVSLSLKSDPGP